MIIDPRLENLKNWQRAMQSYVLMLYEIILENKPEFVLEIGVQRGQSTQTILLALKENNFGKLISIDHKRRNDILDYEYQDLKSYWQFIQGDSSSQETIQKVKDIIGEKEFDVVFIDGCHKLPIVQYDFDNYSEFLKRGGLLLAHDVTNKNEDVSIVWKKLNWKDKFVFYWGKSRNNVIPGMGIAMKPYATEFKNLASFNLCD